MTRSIGIAVLLPAVLAAGTLTHEAVFNPGELTFAKYQGFDVVSLPDGVVAARPGEPGLPEVPLTLAVPPAARVIKVSVEPLETVELGTWRIVPAQPAHPISKPSSEPLTLPGVAVYGSDSAFPGAHSRGFTTGTASGFRLTSVGLCPLQYRPLSGRLSMATRLLVTVTYEDNVLPTQTLTPGQRDRARTSLEPLVANSRDLARYSPPAALADLPEVSYLIVTNAALAPELQPFADYRSATGLRAEIRTVEWAQRNYPGRDVQECVRNLIIDYFQHRGLSYVLLAGDNDEVRCRKIRVNVFDEQGDIPTDLYYGSLEYSWDSNHNDIFGEMNDSVDFYADVFVGRASVDNVHQVENLIRKVTIYENAPAPDYHKRSLLPSGWLWRSSGYHGSFVNDSIGNLTPSPWVDRKLVNPRNSSVVADSFDHGFVLFNPAGHGNSGGVYDENGTPIYLSGNASSQHNYRRYAVMTSLACDPGDFEAEDCLAEYALNCDTAGCIGVVMNSRYGWGTPPSMGPSEKLCVRFWQYYLVQNQSVMGTCHDRSREVYAGYARNDELWRWCVTEFNLFGDPALDIWSEAPASLAVEAPNSLPTGAQTLQALATADGSPLSGALVTAWKSGEVCASGLTGPDGRATIPVHAVTTGGLTVTCTRHNYLPGTATVTVVQGAPEPLIVYARSAIDDAGAANPNGILEPDETGQLTLSVRNAGTGPASNASVILRPLTADVAVPDSTAWYGTIAAGDSAAASDLTVTCGGSVLPGSMLQVLAAVTTDQGSHEFVFGIDVGYPGRLTADIDTGFCALTVTARGSIGLDRNAGADGRGFRYPESDTSTLNTGSFVLTTGPDYVADRFYNLTEGLDADWTLADSVRQRYPLWNADQMLTSAFADAGHPSPHSIRVSERALGSDEAAVAGAVVLVYDLANQSASSLNSAFAGVLADFDIEALDRFHDDAFTRPDLGAVYMRNVLQPDRYCGIKLLTPVAPFHSTCLDNSVYITSDSGMTESMKYRALTGEIGLPQSDRPFNWSVALSTGPFDVQPGATQRIAFAFIGAPSVIAFEQTCAAIQQWYDANVGLAEERSTQDASRLTLQALPNPTRGSVRILLPSSFITSSLPPSSLALFSSSGSLVRSLDIRASSLAIADLPSGVYVLRLATADGRAATTRVTLLR